MNGRKGTITFSRVMTKECANCGETTDVQFHHIIPLSLGGTDRLSNVVCLCRECHSIAHFGNGKKWRGNHGEAVKKGIEKARANGKQIGAPTRIDKEVVMETICRLLRT